MKKHTIQFSYKPFTLNLKHPFTVASNSRTSTPILITEMYFEGTTGYGEASMPPYLGESHASVVSFLQKLDFSRFSDPFEMEAILNYVDAIAPDNNAAKASVDIALHDLVGKLLQKPWYKIWKFDPSTAPESSFTIGMDSPETVILKTIQAKEYSILKVKISTDNDKSMIRAVRSVTDQPIFVDVNQGWTDKHYALDMIFWLKDMGVTLIEQPMPKENPEDIAWLTSLSPLPIFADEAVRRLEDLDKVKGAYSGINIKLMKSTGMHEAFKMAERAIAYGMKTMIGCMTETSCAISAAAQLAPACDYADLDGALLISNDPFEGVKIMNGKIIMNDNPGIGVVKLNNNI